MSNQSPNPQKTQRPSFRRWNRILWGSAAGFVGLFLAWIGLVGAGAFGELPSFEDLENPRNNLATEVYSADGVILGKYYVQNRSYTRYDELSPDLVNAVVATEDIRFYSHSGIDFRALATSFGYTFMGKKRGASTITQQLAKNLYPRESNANIFQLLTFKLKEWITAVRLERRYSKPEIIALYFNTVEFGYNAFGIKSAAKTYFSTTPKDLTLEQSALLVGMLKGIYLYSPKRSPKLALERRRTVLGQMVKYKFLKASDTAGIASEPIALKMAPDTHTSGLATYFREELRERLMNWAASKTKPDGTPYNLYKDGLRIYTTIDSRMQAHAERAVAKHMHSLQTEFDRQFTKKSAQATFKRFPELLARAVKTSDRYKMLKDNGMTAEEINDYMREPRQLELWRWKKNPKGENASTARDTMETYTTRASIMDSILEAKRLLRAGFIVTEPKTGHIKAWVGGINYSFDQYDHARERSKRQVGSTFKPFVYASAIIDGAASPCERIPNEPVTFPDFNNYTPKNYDGKNGGSYTMFQGLAGSINNIVAWLIKYRTSPRNVLELAKALGIKSKLQPYPSIALGAFDCSVVEMVGAYGAIANGGTYRQPEFLTAIKDKFGNTVEEFRGEAKVAMEEESAYAMCKIMQASPNLPNGTSRRLRSYTQAPFACKTGTTQNYSDAWFGAFVPELCGMVWVGAEDRAVHFRGAMGQGSKSALPIFGEFIKLVQRDKALGMKTFKDFEEPSVMTLNLDCSKTSTEASDSTAKPAVDAPAG